MFITITAATSFITGIQYAKHYKSTTAIELQYIRESSLSSSIALHIFETLDRNRASDSIPKIDIECLLIRMRGQLGIIHDNFAPYKSRSHMMASYLEADEYYLQKIDALIPTNTTLQGHIDKVCNRHIIRLDHEDSITIISTDAQE